MAIVNPWRRHYQSFFREQINDSDRPVWDRLAFLAWANAKGNGHANFKPLELSIILDVNPEQVSKALKRAKAKGLIGQESGTRCLVVPGRIAEGGDGSEYEICGVHDGRRVRGKPVRLERFRLNEPMTATEAAINRAVQRS